MSTKTQVQPYDVEDTIQIARVDRYGNQYQTHILAAVSSIDYRTEVLRALCGVRLTVPVTFHTDSGLMCQRCVKIENRRTVGEA